MVAEPAGPGDRVALSEAESRHALGVLRLRDGAPVEVTTPLGTFEGTIVHSGDRAVVELEAAAPAAPAGALWLGVGLAHGAAMDESVRAATEMGVAGIQVLLTERSERLARAAIEARRARWERIAREAVKQCRRPDVPAIPPPRPIAGIAAVHRAIVVLDPGAPPLSHAAGSALVIVGPEGGLTGAEVRALADEGALLAGIPGPILRVPTAVVAALAMMKLVHSAP